MSGVGRNVRCTANPVPGPRVLVCMDTTHIKTKFERLGARAKIRPLLRNRWSPEPGRVVIDVRHDRHGEFFDIQADARGRCRSARRAAPGPPSAVDGPPPQPASRLAGHQGQAPLRPRRTALVRRRCTHQASTVVTAKEALKPAAVQNLERGKRGKRAKRLRRKTDVFIRQGEWFFIPAPDVQVNENLILSNEPIRRGRGKPHMCEELYRDGGTTVYVCGRYPNGLTMDPYRKLLKRNPDAAKWNWQTMARNPIVVVRGKITHPDHATIRLDGWHRVLLNTETGSSSVAFLD